MKQNRRLLLVGNPADFHVGGHLQRAAHKLNLETTLYDVSQAYRSGAWLAKFNWWFRGRRPGRLVAFSEEVVKACRHHHPAWLLTTGVAPLTRDALAAIQDFGVVRMNYLTDDPWNNCHRAGWFLRALPAYEVVYTTKRALTHDLLSLGCLQTRYLPFAFAPEMHFPEVEPNPSKRSDLACDVMFAGGADTDRYPYIRALLQAGVAVRVYGGYWDRDAETRSCWRGNVDPATLRLATQAAKVALCLVRHANRDGHVMRSFEIAAIGACMLAEDTREHREIFGEDGQAVRYFKSIPEMVRKAQELIAHEAERSRLAKAVRELVLAGRHTYEDRLKVMLGLG